MQPDTRMDLAQARGHLLLALGALRSVLDSDDLTRYQRGNLQRVVWDSERASEGVVLLLTEDEADAARSTVPGVTK